MGILLFVLKYLYMGISSNQGAKGVTFGQIFKMDC